MGIVDWFYPKRCVGCGKEGSYICAKCREGIGVRGEGLRYEKVVRKAIKEIKYRGNYDMIAELVGIWMERCKILQPQILQFSKNDAQAINWVVTSVPMWEPKKRQRGFNQAELIAREVAKRWRLSYQEMLVRKRETKAMYGLSRKDRVTNVSDAFRLCDTIYVDTFTRVILVDDVWTSGATMRECSKVLRAGGVKKVSAIALCR